MDNNGYNPNNRNNGRRSADAGSFKTETSELQDDIYSSGANGRNSNANDSLELINQRVNRFSLHIPEDELRAVSRQTAAARQAAQRQTAPSSTTRQTQQRQSVSVNSARRNAEQPPQRSTTARTAQRNTQATVRSRNAETAQPQNAKNTTRKRKPTPEEKKLKRQLKRRQRLRSFVGLIVSVIFIALITGTLSFVAISAINDILCIGKENGVTISVVVDEGDNFDTVFDKLCDNGLIAQKQISKLFCQYRKYDKVEYEPGVYYFDTSDGVEAMLEEMMASNGSNAFVVRLTFPEGWSAAKIFAKIEKYEVCTAEKLYANLDIVASQYAFYENIKDNSNRYLKAEGYLFPDTYEFYKNESASSVLKKFFDNFESHWTSDFSNQAKQLGRSMDEIITVASILQREAGTKAQMNDIASVIYNRLNSSSYPQLQLDSTSDYIYGLNNDYKLFSDYDYSKYYEAYNTYSLTGLPPGPICNPGKDAIEAALNPNQTGYYFFAHDSLGQIYLASSDWEHQQNLAKIFSENEN